MSFERYNPLVPTAGEQITEADIASAARALEIEAEVELRLPDDEVARKLAETKAMIAFRALNLTPDQFND